VFTDRQTDNRLEGDIMGGEYIISPNDSPFLPALGVGVGGDSHTYDINKSRPQIGWVCVGGFLVLL
jgi:hypothetical protein